MPLQSGGSGRHFGNPDALPPSDGSAPPGTDTTLGLQNTTLLLRVLATTDLHAHLLSYDYCTNRPQFGLGLAQTASLIAEARAGVPGSLLLDNGDFLQGSVLADLAAQTGRRRPHPAVAAFNTLGYDAVALGNHEFNYGLPVLTRALRDARFAILSANIARTLGPDPLADDLLFSPCTIVERQLPDPDGTLHPVRIGILGLTPPQILVWDRHHLAGRVVARPMAEAASAWVPELRRRGAEVVICLAHTGLTPDCGGAEEGATGESAEEIARIPGIDAVVAGHSHLVHPPAPLRLPGGTGTAPIVQPGHSGSHLGQIDLMLRHDGTGWQVEESRTEARSASELVAGLSPRALRQAAGPLRTALSADHRAAQERMRRRLGSTAGPLHSYFAGAADNQATRLIGAALRAHTRLRLAGRSEAALPVVATVTPFRMGGRSGPLNYTDIAPGPLSLRHVFDLYPFPNLLVAQLVRGADLVEILRKSSTIWTRLTPGLPDQPLIDPTTPLSRYEILNGMDYAIDLTRPADDRSAGRIGDVRIGGRPLSPETPVVLVTNSYQTGAAPIPGARTILDERTLCTDALVRYITATGNCGPYDGGGWRFVPVPGTSVLYDSGAGAPDNLAEVAHLAPELLGVTAEGFHRFRLHLG